MKEHIDENIKKHIYFKCTNYSLDDFQNYIEEKYNDLRGSINEFFKVDRAARYINLCYELNYEPYVITRIYGLFKIHKPEFPIRPIVSATNCM